MFDFSFAIYFGISIFQQKTSDLIKNIKCIIVEICCTLELTKTMEHKSSSLLFSCCLMDTSDVKILGVTTVFEQFRSKGLSLDSPPQLLV